MKELEPTWGRTISVWWLVAWRTFLVSLILAVLGGASQGALENWSSASPGVARWAPGLVGSILDAVWFIVVVRMALRKHYKEFRIALVPRG